MLYITLLEPMEKMLLKVWIFDNVQDVTAVVTTSLFCWW